MGDAKSGLVKFSQGDIIFNEGDVAKSFYIIQKGQLRLFRPKGRGFIDIAILRSGEVIGEMAFFDKESGRRSCSASAIMDTEVIEISFRAFEKVISGLNPWFKTIVYTLANRIRQSNDKVKSLESNSVGYAPKGEVANYKFFNNADILKMLSCLFLTFKGHGIQKEEHLELHMNKLKFYLFDIFNVSEVKFEEFFVILTEGHFLELGNDSDGLPKLLKIKDINSLRSMIIFINNQRRVDKSKRIQISHKCEIFLGHILDQLLLTGSKSDMQVANITSLLDMFKDKNIPLNETDIADAVNAGLCGDIEIGKANKLTSMVNVKELKKIYPSIKMINAIEKHNESKTAKY